MVQERLRQSCLAQGSLMGNLSLEPPTPLPPHWLAGDTEAQTG